MSIVVDTGLKEIEVDLWGNEWMSLYLDVAERRYSLMNENLNRAFILFALGQAVPDPYNEDPLNIGTTRINPLCLQTKGTGKDPAFNQFRDVLGDTPISLREAGGVNNSSFVGKVDEEGEIRYGIAKEYDIIAWREMNMMFKAANMNYDDGLVENVNNAVDGNPLTRDMANGSISYTPCCSVGGTTYIPPKEKFDFDYYLHSGNIGRYHLHFREVSVETQREMQRKELTRSFDAMAVISDVSRLGATVTAIYENTEPDYSIGFDRDKVVNDIMGMQAEGVREAPYNVETYAMGMAHRHSKQCFRIARLMAALDGLSSTIERKHVDMAMEFSKRSWRSLMELIHHYTPEVDSESDVPPRTLENAVEVQNILHEAGGSLTSEELIEAHSRSRPLVRKAVKYLMANDMLEESGGSGRGNKKTYKLI